MDPARRPVLNKKPVSPRGRLSLPADAQEALFASTMLFQRIVWLARRSALLILPEAAGATASSATTGPA